MNTLRCLASLGILLIVSGPATAQPMGPKASVAATYSPPSPPPGQRATVTVVVTIPRGYHAQSHKPLDPSLIPFEVKLDANPAIAVSPPVYPEGEIKTYPKLGRLSVYSAKVTARIPIEVRADAPAGRLTLRGTVSMQMCDDQSCFPPTDLSFEAAPTDEAPAPATESAMAPAQPRMSYVLLLGIAFLAGLAFNIMPCVLPVLPLKAYGFYEVSQHDRAKSMALGAVFSLGLVSVFAALALLILVMRWISWGEPFSNPFFVGAICLILLVMSLGMFGMFSVNLPPAVYSITPRHDTYTGNFLFGILTAILSTPCTAPLFPTVLIVAQKLPAVAGVTSVMMVGVGMAAPYFLLSAFPELARRFPRTGPFAELFKQMLGFLLLAAVAWFAGGYWLEGDNYWWLILVVAGIASLYMVARSVQLSPNARPVAIASVLAVAMFGGTLYATIANTGILRRSAMPGMVATDQAAPELRWEPYSAELLEHHRKAGRTVLVKFTANWCANCKYVEATVFRDPQVIRALAENNVVALKADLTRNTALGWELLKKLNPAGGIPLTVIYRGQSPEPAQIAGVYTSATLITMISSTRNPS